MILQMKILESFLNSIKSTIYKGVMILKKYNGDYNSSKNQRIKGRLVKEEVISFQTPIVNYILKKSYEDNDPDAPFTYDDVENQYSQTCPNCQEELEELSSEDIEPVRKWKCTCCEQLYDTKKEAENCCYDFDYDGEAPATKIWLCPLCEDEHDTKDGATDCFCHWDKEIYKCYNGHYIYETDIVEEHKEIYEWWEVTSWLADELAKYGECVIRNSQKKYWGRTTTGQAILLDYVISRIAEDMEILEGQENDWSKDDNI